MVLLHDVRRWGRAAGPEGLVILAASLGLIIGTAGISLFAAVCHVLAVARNARSTAPAGGTAVVPGKAPRRGAIDDEHRARLERARRLLTDGRVERIVLLGGSTHGAPVSEAALGRGYLVQRGVDDGRLVVEESSQHTLDNLRQLRLLLPALGATRLVLVSNRYHLARSVAMAAELGLPMDSCAAEATWRFDRWSALRTASEAFFLHWYVVGRFVSRCLGYRRALARIT